MKLKIGKVGTMIPLVKVSCRSCIRLCHHLCDTWHIPETSLKSLKNNDRFTPPLPFLDYILGTSGLENVDRVSIDFADRKLRLVVSDDAPPNPD